MTNNHADDRSQPAVSCAIAIENIEEMRRREGIDDQELHDEIGRLNIGDLVRLTLRVSRHAAETVVYRITSKNKADFRGECASLPLDARLQRLTNGQTLCFSANHIHSVCQRGAIRQ